jgi:hypothetical protein
MTPRPEVMRVMERELERARRAPVATRDEIRICLGRLWHADPDLLDDEELRRAQSAAVSAEERLLTLFYRPEPLRGDHQVEATIGFALGKKAAGEGRQEIALQFFMAAATRVAAGTDLAQKIAERVAYLGPRVEGTRRTRISRAFRGVSRGPSSYDDDEEQADPYRRDRDEEGPFTVNEEGDLEADS